MNIVIDIPEDVIEGAKSSPNYYPAYHFDKIWRAIVNGIPLEQKPKTAHWIKKENDVCYWYECSICGRKPLKYVYGYDALSSYCPNCGARMES